MSVKYEWALACILYNTNAAVCFTAPMNNVWYLAILILANALGKNMIILVAYTLGKNMIIFY